MGYREKWFQANKNIFGLYMCVNCKKLFPKEQMHIDHIIPKNKGGTDELWNLQCMCQHCNCSKQDNTKDSANDLIINIGKNIYQKQQINNADDLIVNMIKKNTLNFIKKQFK